MALNENFAANTKRLRNRRKMTQAKLADAAGITVSYVSMLERAQRSPPLETVEKVAKALGVPPVDMLKG